MEILRFIAEHSPVTVREVADFLARTKGQTRTTALNVMERLREKGHLVREKPNGIFRYRPSLPREDMMRGVVRDFVRESLGGTVQPFVAYLAEEATVNNDDLEELKRLVAALEQRKENETGGQE
jgi:predicted transcriptional regulator